MGDDQKPQDQAGPEEFIKWRAIPDADKDAEGHTMRAGKAVPDADAPGPEDIAKVGRVLTDQDQDVEGHGRRGA